MGVDLEEVFAGKNFSPGKKKPKNSHLREIIKQLEIFGLGELAPASFHVCHRQIVVAMQTLERAAASHLDRDLERSALVRIVLMDDPAEIGVCRCTHRLSPSTIISWSTSEGRSRLHRRSRRQNQASGMHL